MTTAELVEIGETAGLLEGPCADIGALAKRRIEARRQAGLRDAGQIRSELDEARDEAFSNPINIQDHMVQVLLQKQEEIVHRIVTEGRRTTFQSVDVDELIDAIMRDTILPEIDREYTFDIPGGASSIGARIRADDLSPLDEFIKDILANYIRTLYQACSSSTTRGMNKDLPCPIFECRKSALIYAWRCITAYRRREMNTPIAGSIWSGTEMSTSDAELAWSGAMFEDRQTQVGLLELMDRIGRAVLYDRNESDLTKSNPAFGAARLELFKGLSFAPLAGGSINPCDERQVNELVQSMVDSLLFSQTRARQQREQRERQEGQLVLPDFKNFPQLLAQLEILMKRLAIRGEVNTALEGALWPQESRKQKKLCRRPISEFRENLGKHLFSSEGRMAKFFNCLYLYMMSGDPEEWLKLKQGARHPLRQGIEGAYFLLELCVELFETGSTLSNPNASGSQKAQGTQLMEENRILSELIGEYATALEAQMKSGSRLQGAALPENAQTLEALVARVRQSGPAEIAAQFVEQAQLLREAHESMAQTTTRDETTDAAFAAAGIGQNADGN